MTDDKTKDKDRDWDQEMRDVNRLLSKLDYGDAKPGSAPTQRNPAAAGALSASGPTVAGSWAKVILGVALGVGMAQWPYAHGCGVRLIFYLIGVAAVLAVAVWSGLSSWKRRIGPAHVLSHLLIVWGTLLAAREVLPRLDTGKTADVWLCPDVRTNSR